MCEVGVANGLLSREVINSKRSRLFFFWASPEPSPSTSALDLVRFGSRRWDGADEMSAKEKAGENGASMDRSKANGVCLTLSVSKESHSWIRILWLKLAIHLFAMNDDLTVQHGDGEVFGGKMCFEVSSK